MNRPHIPVLEEEVLKGFEGCSLSVFFEGTVGAGGHASSFLRAHPEIERYLGSDVDPTALQMAKATLTPWENKVELIQGNFRHLGSYLKERKIKTVDGFFLT